MQRERKTIEWERLVISKKIRDTKGTFHAKMGKIKDRNSTDLTEKAMALHASTLAWKIPSAEEPSGLQSMGLQRVGYD